MNTFTILKSEMVADIQTADPHTGFQKVEQHIFYTAYVQQSLSF